MPQLRLVRIENSATLEINMEDGRVAKVMLDSEKLDELCCAFTEVYSQEKDSFELADLPEAN